AGPAGLGPDSEQPQAAAVLDAVPAHVRDLASRWKAAHDAGNHVETAALAELFAAGEEQLIAETDAEKRSRTVERAAQRSEQAESLEIGHRIVKRAVAREHHGSRIVHGARILSDRCGHADARERLFDRA